MKWDQLVYIVDYVVSVFDDWHKERDYFINKIAVGKFISDGAYPVIIMMLDFDYYFTTLLYNKIMSETNEEEEEEK